eukprot:TRINITY_DN17316_c0_g1_i1.p1 TRINITY_DN17316_c0_g1~~TRINITY_DN17316_c0_g1_i1.p1  ORF type:complete len:432 (+),score=125.36 TRINITY_DN17316_c0_g1_i1:81-1376(+)
MFRSVAAWRLSLRRSTRAYYACLPKPTARRPLYALRTASAVASAGLCLAALPGGPGAVPRAKGSDDTFEVASGVLKGRYDAIYLSTDLEPDDIVAIRALAPKLKRAAVPLFVVVGEGNVEGKVEMMADVLAAYGLLRPGTKIVQGALSGERYPPAALEAFKASRPSATAMASAVVKGDAAALSEAFLKEHRAPLAILLKPPHELANLSEEVLARTAAVAYGSFNFVRFREDLQKAASSSKVTKAAALERQASFLKAFKAFVWVERSLTVGSSGTLNRDHESAWKALAAGDEGLMTIVREWNVASVQRCAKRLKTMCKQMLAACDTGQPDAALFGTIRSTYEKNQKSIDILSEIARLAGDQICLADPIVSAVLLDERGELAAYEKRSAVRLSKSGQPTLTPDKSSSVALLHAEGEAAKFSQIVFGILERAVE